MQHFQQFTSFVKQYNLTSYTAFESKLASLSNPKDKGDLFEGFSFAYFTGAEEQMKHMWRPEELPKEISQMLHTPTRDKGIDFILETNDHKFIALQVKYRSDITTVIPWSDLRGFPGLVATSNKFHYGIFLTNCEDCIDEISRSEKFIVKLQADLQKLDYVFSSILDKNLPLFALPPLRQCQTEALKNIGLYHFQHNYKNIRGKIILPPGSGKTRIQYELSQNINSSGIENIYAVLLPSLYLQNQSFQFWRRADIFNQIHRKYLLIGSDVVKEERTDFYETSEYRKNLSTTDEAVIYRFFKEEGDKMIFCTYQSTILLGNVIEKANIKIQGIFFDEAHLTAGPKNGMFSLFLDKKWDRYIDSRLFFTATPKIYKINDAKTIRKKNLENEDSESENEESESENEDSKNEDSENEDSENDENSDENEDSDNEESENSESVAFFI